MPVTFMEGCGRPSPAGDDAQLSPFHYIFLLSHSRKQAKMQLSESDNGIASNLL